MADPLEFRGLESGDLVARLVDELDDVAALFHQRPKTLTNFDQSFIVMLIFIRLSFMGLDQLCNVIRFS